jgi:hypothetical protein
MLALTLIDAGFSAVTRTDEHRRFVNYSRTREYSPTNKLQSRPAFNYS